ncbi:MAG: carboxypeptidase regulatory-like domain-containing protein [Polyangiaceae bacterium]|nr:carboxypeptidase regulatory-like domain-containing protein [Polyangiaceae bacterium]
MTGRTLSERFRQWLVTLACVVVVVGMVDTPVAQHQPLLVPTFASAAQLLVAVTTPSGKAARAEVRVYCPLGDKYREGASGATDASGVVVLNDLPAASCWLLVSSKEYARVALLRTLKKGLQHVRVQLAHAEAVAVKVSDESGKPLVRASVLVDVPGALPYGALTDERGMALFSRLTPGPFRVRVYAEGLEPGERLQVRKEVSLVLGRLASLLVRVKEPGGKAAKAADVFLAGASLWPPRRVATNSAGEVNILGLPEGVYEVKAQRGSLVGTARTPLALTRGAKLTLDVTLHEGQFVLVEVSEEGLGEARIANAEVVVAEEGLSFFPLRGKTGKNGQISLGPLAEGGLGVSAFAEGFVATHALPVAFPFPKPIPVKLLRGATLSGRVQDARGFAVPGASIEVIGNDVFGLPVAETPQALDFERSHFAWAESGPRLLIPVGELGVMPGPVPPIPGRGEALAGGAVQPPATAAWVTGEDGRFKAFPVTPGRVFVIARHPDFVDGMSDAVVLSKGGHAEVVITLLAGGELFGTVKDDRGFAVAGARVEAMAARGTLRRNAWTEADGSFRFATLPAQVVVTVARPEAPFQPVYRETFSVVPNQRQEIEIALTPLRDKVKFRVLGQREEPLLLAQVSVASLTPSAPFRKTLFTDAEGYAELEDAAGRNVQYTVSAPGYALSRHSEASLKTRVEVKLALGVRVEGVVRGVRGHVNVEGASVSAQVEGVRFFTTTDNSGHFILENVPPAKVSFEVRHPDFAPQSIVVQVPTADTHGRPLVLDPWTLEAAGRVTGRVLNQKREPVSGARVSVGEVSEFLPVGTLPPEVVFTDAEGHFELQAVKEGPAELHAQLAGVGKGKLVGVVVFAGKLVEAGDLVLSEAYEALPILGASVAVSLREGEFEGQKGVMIGAVANGSEAERAGLRDGDVLLSVDGRQVTSSEEARRAFEGPEGSDVSLELLRAKERLHVSVLRERVRR